MTFETSTSFRSSILIKMKYGMLIRLEDVEGLETESSFKIVCKTHNWHCGAHIAGEKNDRAFYFLALGESMTFSIVYKSINGYLSTLCKSNYLDRCFQVKENKDIPLASPVRFNPHRPVNHLNKTPLRKSCLF